MTEIEEMKHSDGLKGHTDRTDRMMKSILQDFAKQEELRNVNNEVEGLKYNMKSLLEQMKQQMKVIDITHSQKYVKLNQTVTAIDAVSITNTILQKVCSYAYQFISYAIFLGLCIIIVIHAQHNLYASFLPALQPYYNIANHQ